MPPLAVATTIDTRIVQAIDVPHSECRDPPPSSDDTVLSRARHAAARYIQSAYRRHAARWIAHTRDQSLRDLQDFWRAYIYFRQPASCRMRQPHPYHRSIADKAYRRLALSDTALYIQTLWRAHRARAATHRRRSQLAASQRAALSQLADSCEQKPSALDDVSSTSSLSDSSLLPPTRPGPSMPPESLPPSPFRVHLSVTTAGVRAHVTSASRVIRVVREDGFADASLYDSSTSNFACALTDCVSAAPSGSCLRLASSFPYSRYARSIRPNAKWARQRHWQTPSSLSLHSPPPDSSSSSPFVYHLHARWSDAPPLA